MKICENLFQRPGWELAVDFSEAPSHTRLTASGNVSHGDKVLLVHRQRVVAVLGRCPEEGRRPSFSGVVCDYAVPRRCNLDIVIQDDGWRRVPCISFVAERPSLVPPAMDEALLPLPVTGLGRSGSTLLMKMLSFHPGILVEGGYPYESIRARRCMNEFMHSLRSRGAGVSPGLRDVADWFRLVAADGSPPGGCEATYLAEKNMFPENLFWELFPSMKELLLVRDPRDVICSALAFNAKRGRVKFGRQFVSSDADYVEYMALRAAERLLYPLEERGASLHVVRYEDLMTDPGRVVAGICGYLGLDGPEEMMAALATATGSGDVLAFHKTSASAADSLGRFRREMPAPLQARCLDAMRDVLRAFDYKTC